MNTKLLCKIKMWVMLPLVILLAISTILLPVFCFDLVHFDFSNSFLASLFWIETLIVSIVAFIMAFVECIIYFVRLGTCLSHNTPELISQSTHRFKFIGLHLSSIATLGMASFFTDGLMSIGLGGYLFLFFFALFMLVEIVFGFLHSRCGKDAINMGIKQTINILAFLPIIAYIVGYFSNPVNLWDVTELFLECFNPSPDIKGILCRIGYLIFVSLGISVAYTALTHNLSRTALRMNKDYTHGASLAAPIMMIIAPIATVLLSDGAVSFSDVIPSVVCAHILLGFEIAYMSTPPSLYDTREGYFKHFVVPAPAASPMPGVAPAEMTAPAAETAPTDNNA